MSASGFDPMHKDDAVMWFRCCGERFGELAALFDVIAGRINKQDDLQSWPRWVRTPRAITKTWRTAGASNWKREGFSNESDEEANSPPPPWGPLRYQSDHPMLLTIRPDVKRQRCGKLVECPPGDVGCNAGADLWRSRCA